MALKSVLAGLLLLVVYPVSALHAFEPVRSPAQKVEAMVRAAADLVKAKGEAVFPEFRKKGSKWLGREHYIFIFDEKGPELVNGGFPKMEGKNRWDHKDTSGLYVIREEVALVKAKGSGWIDVLWPRPGQTRAVKSRSFLQGVTVGDRLLIVGAPLYLE